MIDWKPIALALCMACAQSCATAEKVVISAADVVDEVARKGDQIDAISVEACHEAESAAADIPDLDKAERAVQRIRSGCDQVFGAIDALEAAIETVDRTFASVQIKEATLEDLVGAAMKARQAYDRAAEASEQLREILEQEIPQ